MAIELTEQLLTQIDGYLQGTLTDIERETFEKRLQQDPDLQEEIHLQRQLFDTLGKEAWHSIQRNENKERLAALKSKLRSKEYQGLSANIRNAEKVYIDEQSKTNPFKKYYRYFAIAGMIILFFGIYFSQTNTSLDSYYEANVNWSSLQSFAEKGQQEDLFSQAEIAFRAAKYEEAAAKFSQIETSYELYTYSLIYLGASYDQLNENDKAIATFQKLGNVSDPYESSKSYWYETLIHLKMNNKEKAISSLQNVVKNVKNYKYEEAKKLIEVIE